MEIATLDKFHEAMAILRSASARAGGISDSLSHIGMDKLASDVGSISDAADAAYELVRGATNEAVQQAFNASQEATGNMVMAVLAVTTQSASRR